MLLSAATLLPHSCLTCLALLTLPTLLTRSSSPYYTHPTHPTHPTLHQVVLVFERPTKDMPNAMV